MPITIVCGLAWAVVVRAGLRRMPGAGSVGPSPLGALHVAVLLGVVAFGAAIVPLAKAA